MTTTTEKPDHRSLPRKKHTPTERDQAIYVAYRSQGLTQEKLAADLKVSQRRVSQIIQRVHRWVSDASTCNSELETCNLLRLERHLQRERSQAVFDRALRAHDQGVQELKTTRHGKRGDTSFEETVTREVLPSPQHLRTAIQASRELDKIADKPAPPPVGCVASAVADGTPLPAHEKKPDDKAALWKQTLSALYQARQQAEDEKKVVQGHGHLDYLGTVQHWLDALLGNRPEYFHPEDISPGTPLHELATFYLGRPRSTTSVPGSSLGPHDPEAPASAHLDTLDDLSEPTLNLEPRTLNSPPSNPSNASNPAPKYELPSKPEAESQPDLPPSASIQNPKSKIPNLYARRLAHQRKLEQFYEANRRGLPIQLEFDPEDGPLPELSGHLDDYGYIPTPPNKEDEAQLVQDYLAKLRAERIANA